MANPSLKNGYLSIAIELVEKFASFYLSNAEMKIIWVVWRKTWGWAEGDRHKDWDIISISQFSKATTMTNKMVVRATKCLKEKNILLKEEKGYKFNQDYDKWIVSKRTSPVSKQTVSKLVVGSVQMDTKPVSKQTHTIERKKYTKDISNAPPNGDAKLISEIIFLFTKINPACKNYYNNKTQRPACEDLIQTYGFDRVKSVIEKTLPITNSMNYMPNITTPYELREKWAKLEAEIMKRRLEAKASGEKYKIAFSN